MSISTWLLLSAILCHSVLSSSLVSDRGIKIGDDVLLSIDDNSCSFRVTELKEDWNSVFVNRDDNLGTPYRIRLGLVRDWLMDPPLSCNITFLQSGAAASPSGGLETFWWRANVQLHGLEVMKYKPAKIPLPQYYYEFNKHYSSNYIVENNRYDWIIHLHQSKGEHYPGSLAGAAIRFGKLDILEFIQAYAPTLLIEGDYPFCARAIRYNKFDILAWLLEQKFEMNQKDHHRLLENIVIRGEISRLDLLSGLSSDIIAEEISRQERFDLAGAFVNKGLLSEEDHRLLTIAQIENYSAIDNLLESYPHPMVQRELFFHVRNPKIFTYLLKRGVAYTNDQVKDRLLLAIKARDFEFLDLVLERGISLGRTEMAEILFNQKEHAHEFVNWLKKHSTEQLGSAARPEELFTTDWLMDTDIRYVDWAIENGSRFSSSDLLWAVHSANFDVTQRLIKIGIPITKEIMRRAANGPLNIFRELIENGGDIDLRGDIALRPEIAQYIEAKRANSTLGPDKHSV